MKFNQTRLFFSLIILINIATVRLTANEIIDTLPGECSYWGTIVMPVTDFCGPYILLDNGLKIRPADTLLSETHARVKVGFEVVDSSCGEAMSVLLTCLQIIPDSSCNASFTYEMLRCGSDSALSRCPDNTYRFNNTSEGSVQTVLWDFGDGTICHEENPTHSFPLPGIYNICLSITTDNDCYSTTCQTIIIPDTATYCKAEIMYYPIDLLSDSLTPGSDSSAASIIPSYGYFFSDVSNHEVIDRSWDFGDGTTSSNNNIAHFYNLPGVYQVCLTISTEEGCTDTECITVIVGNPDGCIADFSYKEIFYLIYDIYLPQGFAYMFYDESNIDVLKRIWIINGDSIYDEPNPIYTFPSSGEYQVCLQIYTPGGCFAQKCKTIVIDNSICKTDFSYEIAEPDCRGYSPAYIFSPIIFNFPLNYYWSFGDSTSSEEAYPVHYYRKCGYYNICLTVTYLDSCTAKECKTIFVPDIPKYVVNSKCGQVDIENPNQSISGDVSVFPNPAEGIVYFNINSKINQNIDIEVIDILGQVRLTYRNLELTTGDNQLEVNLQHLPTGNYIYLINSPGTALRGSISVVK